MQKRIAAVFVPWVAVCAVSATVHTQSSDPWIGTWKMDLAKSTFSPGPPPNAGTTKIEPAPGGLKITNEGTTATGEPVHTEIVATFDGKGSS